MKRDFKDEYQEYIESDMPDLWSRIEPNLKEKAPADTGRKRSNIYLIKTLIPAAACLCLLLVGIGALSLNRGAKDGAAYDAGAADGIAETSEAPMEMPMEAENEEAEGGAPGEIWEEAAEDGAAAEEIARETAEEEFAADESMTEAAREETATAKAEKPAAEAAQDSDMVNAPAANGGNGEAVDIEKAVLTKIAVASEQMQEKGYAYVYTFELSDGSRILAYLTEALCDELEERGIVIERQSAYALSLSRFHDPESEMSDLAEEEYILQKIEKLP